MTNISLNLPGIVRVEDTTTHHGHEVKVLYIFDHAVAYFTGQQCNDMEPADWEDVFTHFLAKFMAKQIVEQFPQEWSTTNPTGRELYSPYPRNIEYTEDRG